MRSSACAQSVGDAMHAGPARGRIVRRMQDAERDVGRCYAPSARRNCSRVCARCTPASHRDDVTIAALVLRIGFHDSQKAQLHGHRMAISRIGVKIFLLPKVATRSPRYDDRHGRSDSASWVTRVCRYVAKCRMMLRHSHFLKCRHLSMQVFRWLSSLLIAEYAQHSKMRRRCGGICLSTLP